MDTPEIRSAGPGDEDVAISLVTLAFSNDPLTRWVNPDPARYLAIVPQIARAFGGNGFAHGTVLIAGDGLGTAMWLPPGVAPDSERMEQLFGESAAPDILPDLGGVMVQAASFHPAEPHWYLPIIAVDPAAQGQGVGSALMRHALARSDADGVPAYLESSNPRNISLYERCGFERLATIQVGSSPPVVPMLRRPH
jgi:ribosomal protein S18 acetylase RimI-like enzyme